jgi:hypothetical protein
MAERVHDIVRGLARDEGLTGSEIFVPTPLIIMRLQKALASLVCLPRRT